MTTEDALHQLLEVCSKISSTRGIWPSCSICIFSTFFWKEGASTMELPLHQNKGAVLLSLLVSIAQIKIKGKLSAPSMPESGPIFFWEAETRGLEGNLKGKELKEVLTRLTSPKKQGVLCLSISARRQDRKRHLGVRKRYQAAGRNQDFTYNLWKTSS